MVAVGLVCLYAGLRVEDSDLAAEGAHRIATHIMYSFTYVPCGLGLLARGYLLHACRYRAAYHALTASLAWLTVFFIAFKLHNIIVVSSSGCSWQDATYLLLHHR